jgi:hypothetical protein
MFHILTNVTLLQLNPVTSVPSAKSVGNVDEVKSRDDAEVYQQVKYFRRSIHEVNQLLESSGFDVMDPVDKTYGSLRRTCDSEVIQAEEMGVTQEIVQTQDVIRGCEMPQECSMPFIEARSDKRSTEDCEEVKPGHTGQHDGCADGVMESDSGADCDPVLHSCDTMMGVGLQDTQCQSVENHQEASRFCDSVIERCMVVHTKTPEKRTKDDRNESVGSSVCPSTESPQLSPEHRRSGNLDPNPNRRKFESEIGRDILRERRMKQELEEMRIANQG